LDKVIKRDDIENIVSSIMGKLVINLKKEIKQEIMIEVGKENTFGYIRRNFLDIGSGNKACNHLLLRHVNVFKSIISRR
jgi:hypothetical protein